jgi:hypothetical protein
LIVHHDLDAVRAVFMPLATNGDGETREKTDREHDEENPAIGHDPRCSPENNKTRREAGLAAVA